MRLLVTALAVWGLVSSSAPMKADEAAFAVQVCETERSGHEGRPVTLAQLKPHERGNCFAVKGCKGDSIGMLWVHAPEFCATMGGKSWVDQTGKCRNLPDGPYSTHGPIYNPGN